MYTLADIYLEKIVDELKQTNKLKKEANELKKEANKDTKYLIKLNERMIKMQEGLVGIKKIETNTDIEKKEVDDINNWINIAPGLYKYDIDGKFWYEIHLSYWEESFNTNNKASLYIVGQRSFYENEKPVFEKRCLLEDHSVFECLKLVKSCIKEG